MNLSLPVRGCSDRRQPGISAERAILTAKSHTHVIPARRAPGAGETWREPPQPFEIGPHPKRAIFAQVRGMHTLHWLFVQISLSPLHRARDRIAAAIVSLAPAVRPAKLRLR
jgi:hypothetical protein